MLVGDCEDTDKGLTDEDGDGCDFYTKNPHSCGDYDGNEGFVANQMCCACGGGKGRGKSTAKIDYFLYKFENVVSTLNPCVNLNLVKLS